MHAVYLHRNYIKCVPKINFFRRLGEFSSVSTRASLCDIDYQTKSSLKKSFVVLFMKWISFAGKYVRPIKNDLNIDCLNNDMCFTGTRGHCDLSTGQYFLWWVAFENKSEFACNSKEILIFENLLTCIINFYVNKQCFHYLDHCF